jgi:hypothetical protein
MFNKGRLLVIVIVIGILVLAAIEFLPGTSYFPMVEYTTPGDIRFVVLKKGAPLDESGCDKSTRDMESAVRASCADCKTVMRCVHELNAQQRKILSREPLATPSLRTQDGRLTMTVAAADPEVALSVCRLAAEQTATRTADKRLLCFPALASR